MTRARMARANGGTIGAQDALDRIGTSLRRGALRSALRAGAKPVVREAKRLAPQPGYRGDKPGLVPLRDTIGTVIREYGTGVFLAVVGPRRPEGAHGHLVRLGHRIVTRDGTDTGARVEGKEFLAPAADSTRAEQERELVARLRAEARKEAANAS